MKLNNLKDLVFFVTNRCNLHCIHCFYWQPLSRPVDELDSGQIKTILSSFKRPLHRVTLTGGEPFLRYDLAGICKLFHDLCKTKNIYILTNGYFPEIIYETALRILKIRGLKLHIAVSLDGFRETHNYVRNDENSFDNAVMTIRRLKTLEKKFDFHLRVSTSICQENLSELVGLSKLVRKELNVALHVFEITRDASFFSEIPKNIKINDYGPQDKSILLSQKQLKELRSNIKKFYLIGPYISLKNLLLRIYYVNVLKLSLLTVLKKKRAYPCSAGNTIGVIYADGNLSFCEATQSIGNLKEANLDFDQIWHSEEANKKRRQMKNCCCSNTCYLFASLRHHYHQNLFDALK